MRKAICVLIIALLVLSACSNSDPNNSVQNTSESSSFIAEQDSQYRYPSVSMNYICETKYAYYFLGGPQINYLYIHDKESGTTVPLCNKPNCKHTEETDNRKTDECNAYLGFNPKFLRSNMNSIYYVVDEFVNNVFVPVFYKMSLDGTDRKRLFVFSEEPTNLVIHRGYIYYTTFAPIESEANNLKFEYKLYRIDLANVSKKQELIDEGNGLSGSIARILCYGDYLFYNVQYYKDETFQDFISYINVYDIQNKTIRKFLDECTASFTIFNNNFIYIAREVDGTMYMCDLSGGNVDKVKSSAKGGCSTNGNYIMLYQYLETNRIVTILDRKFNIIKTVTLDTSYVTPIGCSDDYYFISKRSDDNSNESINMISVIPLDGDGENMNPEIFH